MTTAPVFFRAVVAPGEIRLEGDEGRHAAGVRRLTPGERLDLVDGTGRRGQGVVLIVHGRDALTVRIETVVVEPAPDPAFVVVQALPKGDRSELAVELMTEGGVDEVVPWSANRCVTRWSGDRGQKSLAKWRSTSAEAAKQSRRARWPVVAELSTTAQIAARCEGAAASYVLHEDATESLAGTPKHSGAEVIVIVGPEGGVDDGELAAFTAAGARPVRLGPEILRTSTAGIVALSVLSGVERWSA